MSVGSAELAVRSAFPIGLLLMGAGIASLSDEPSTAGGVLLLCGGALVGIGQWFSNHSPRFSANSPLPAPRRPRYAPKEYEGQFIKVRERAPVYMIQGGARFHVSTWSELEGIAGRDDFPLPAFKDWRTVYRISVIPREDFIVQEYGSKEQWRISDGKRYLIDSATGQAATIPRGGLSQIPRGNRDVGMP